MIARDATPFDVAYVCTHMRALNVEETEALRGKVNRLRLAAEINHMARLACFRLALCLELEPWQPLREPLGAATGEPVAIVAAYALGQGQAAVQLFATHRWPEINRAAYRFLKRHVIGELFPRHGITWAATDVLDRGYADRAWLRRLGFRDCETMELGHNGEKFRRVAWGAVDAAAAALASAHPGARSGALTSAGKPPWEKRAPGPLSELPHV